MKVRIFCSRVVWFGVVCSFGTARHLPLGLCMREYHYAGLLSLLLLSLLLLSLLLLSLLLSLLLLSLKSWLKKFWLSRPHFFRGYDDDIMRNSSNRGLQGVFYCPSMVWSAPGKVRGQLRLRLRFLHSSAAAKQRILLKFWHPKEPAAQSMEWRHSCVVRWH
jgi:hypothetical protein